MSDGWEESAAAWLEEIGERGDFGRAFVLDAPMMERVRAQPVATALDVGCGEGRFCRMLAAEGIAAIGIDPTDAFLREARRRDPDGDYRSGRAEALDFPNAAFDLVVSYITLVDIPDIRTAIAEMARVLRPGGRLLIANLNSFSTAVVGGGWTADASGERRFSIDNYLTERAEWVEWRGVRVINRHRPLSTYLSLLIGAGLQLTFFSEPARTAASRRRPTAIAASPTTSSWNGKSPHRRVLRRNSVEPHYHLLITRTATHAGAGAREREERRCHEVAFA